MYEGDALDRVARYSFIDGNFMPVLVWIADGPCKFHVLVPNRDQREESDRSRVENAESETKGRP